MHQGQYLLQVVHGFRVGVADGNRLAALPGQPDQPVELLIDADQIAFIIQKDIAPGVGKPHLPGHLLCHGMTAGAAVYKEQLVCLQFRHQPAHGLLLFGKRAAHMVVQAAGLGNLAQGLAHRIQ